MSKANSIPRGKADICNRGRSSAKLQTARPSFHRDRRRRCVLRGSCMTKQHNAPRPATVCNSLAAVCHLVHTAHELPNRQTELAGKQKCGGEQSWSLPNLGCWSIRSRADRVGLWRCQAGRDPHRSMDALSIRACDYRRIHSCYYRRLGPFGSVQPLCAIGRCRNSLIVCQQSLVEKPPPFGHDLSAVVLREA